MRGLFLLFGVPVFIISLVILFRHYMHSSEKQNKIEVRNMELLLEKGKETNAIFDSSYFTTKRRGQEVGSIINYKFKVGSKIYEYDKYFKYQKDIPAEREFKILYLENNPDIHSDNPQQELEKLNLKLKEGSTPIYGWWMFGITLLGFAYIRWSLKKDLKKKQETDQLLAQYNN